MTLAKLPSQPDTVLQSCCKGAAGEQGSQEEATGGESYRSRKLNGSWLAWLGRHL